MALSKEEALLIVTKKLRLAYIVVGYAEMCQTAPGVAAKIDAQVKAFEISGICSDVISVNYDSSVRAKVGRRLPFFSDGMQWESLDLNDYQCVYIRRPQFISKDFINFFSRIKQSYPEMLLLFEIPTYPYDQEDRSLRLVAMRTKDRIHRKELKNCVDKIIDLSGAKQIFGIDTIRISNGVDLSIVKPRKSIANDEKSINLICVAGFQQWHGVDRLLQGMRTHPELLSQRRICVHLVGEGPALSSIKKLVSELDIENHVVFYGQCDRSQMDSIYDKCSFAIASLGLHRIGIERASTLKTREYLAKGMPFVYAGEIDTFINAPVDFCMKVSPTDEPVDIPALVNFHDKLYSRETSIALIGRIRSYADSHVSMQSAMKNVITYIEENCSND